MEKIFRPNKWFVIFCALLVAVWGGLQLVANMRLADEAKQEASQIFTWDWPTLNCFSKADVTDATVVRRTDSDAIVKVSGKQVVTTAPPNTPVDFKTARSDVVDVNVTLTFYRSSNQWVLGKVEIP